MLKDELWTRRIHIEVKVIILRKNQVREETILLDKIRRNQTREQEVQKELDKDNRQAWKDNRIVYMEGKIYILNNQKIQEQILQEYHELADIGYLGQQRMFKLIKRNYWWLGIRSNIKKYIQGYTKYQ